MPAKLWPSIYLINPACQELTKDMKKYQLSVLVIAMTGLVLAGCDKKPEAPAPAEQSLTTPYQKYSYGLGWGNGKTFAQDGVQIDPDLVARGMRDGMAGKESLVSPEAMKDAAEQLQKEADERAQKKQAALADAGKKLLEDNAKKNGVVVTESGLQYEILTKADGTQPKETDTVVVDYEGKLPDGTVFDSSIQRGQPAELPVNAVIPGWVELLQLMHVGEKARVVIPSDLAYGEYGRPPVIPPNAVLTFEITLKDIKKEEAGDKSADAGQGDDDKPAATETQSK